MEKNPDLALTDEKSSIEAIIDEYLKNMREIIYGNYSVKDSVTHYFGRGKAQKSPLHKQFYDDMEKAARSLSDELESSPDEDKALKAVDTILNYGREDFKSLEDNIRLTMIAIEALAIPLLPFVNKDELVIIKEEYAKKYPARERLPKQTELYQSMCELSGEKVKKKRKGFFDIGEGKNRSSL